MTFHPPPCLPGEIACPEVVRSDMCIREEDAGADPAGKPAPRQKTQPDIRMATSARDCRIRRNAGRDPLTGLHDRPTFLARLEMVLAETGVGGTLVMIDMVRFRTINDTLGHEAGDEMLRVVGQRLAQGRRAIDIIARLCGDEFALVVPNIVSESAAQPVFARLIETLRQSHAIDRLKIDRSFVGGIPDSGEDAIIVRTTIDLAHDLGMDVVAEGIETQTHLTWLTAHHCDIGQGYFLGRPEDVEDAIARLAGQNRKRQKAG